jgi:hypothetical protein
VSIEYRVCCRVNMVGGEWEGDWFAWEGDEGMTADEIRAVVSEKTWEGEEPGRVTRALDEALEMSGFDYWVETREATS